LLQRLLNVDTYEQFAQTHKQWVGNKLTNKQTRQEQFTQSVAVGSEAFIAGVQKALGIRAKGRNIASAPNGAYQLPEPICEYGNASSEKKTNTH
jgi:putative transposase